MLYRRELLPAERYRFECLGNALCSHGSFFHRGAGLPPGLFPTPYMIGEALFDKLFV